MTEIASILDQTLVFDPATDFEAFVRSAPAKGAVYLLADVDGKPVQLLCVKNLRYSLKRRLGGEETIGQSKRVNYRDLVRRIFFRRVDSDFEADWIYYEAARAVFPDTYGGMVGFRPAWFIHVDPDAKFPRFAKTTELSPRAGQFIGPVADKQDAQKLIELAEDSFDLCRYYNILVEAPHGKACAYKEMGKCPAPCDGSIGMEQYSRMIGWAADTVVDPAKEIASHTNRMKSAAGALKFEVARKIKSLIDQLSQFGNGKFRYARRLEDFSFVSLQRGPWRGCVKVFLLTPGRIEPLMSIVDAPERPSEMLRYVLESTASSHGVMDSVGAERLGIVVHHLLAEKKKSGVILPIGELDDRSLMKAYRDVLKQKVVDETEDEGVTKELQAM